jgi:hypothetical protein
MLSLLALDAYNRGEGAGVGGLEVLSNTTKIGRATLISDSDTLIGENAIGAGFYAIAYDMTGVEGFSAGEKVISYRGTDNYNPFAPSNDLWNGWTLGAGFADASQGGCAAQFA